MIYPAEGAVDTGGAVERGSPAVTHEREPMGKIAVAAVAVALSLAACGGSGLTPTEQAIVKHCTTNGTSNASECQCFVSHAEAHGIPAKRLLADELSHQANGDFNTLLNAGMACINPSQLADAIAKLKQALQSP